MIKPKRYWKITGWDSSEKVFQERIGVGQISDKKLKDLLRALTVKLALAEREIISSYANKKTKIHHDFLEVNLVQETPFMYSCGHNPHVTAEAVEEASLQTYIGS